MMSKGNGNGKSGNGQALVAAPTMSEELAIGIAHGAAAAAYEVVAAQSAGGNSRLPNGRWWYASGEPMERAAGEAMVLEMARFVADAPGAPWDALAGHVAARLPKRPAGLSLAERCAFKVFVRTLPELLSEAREEDRRRIDALPPPPPPPDKGVWRRTGSKRRKWGDRVVMDHAGGQR